jgi:hypothetical protein
MSNFDVNAFANDSLGRRTLVTVLAMVGGAVGVVGVLSLMTVLVLGRAVGGSSSDAPAASEEASDTAPAGGALTKKPAAPRTAPAARPLARPAPTQGTQI